MAEDEAATIRTISDYREAIAMRVRKHRGRVVDAPGDNVIVRVGLARFYEREGRHEEAQIAVREILGVTPDLTAERAMQLIPGWEELLGPEEFALSPDDLRAAGLP
jgi:hypothetical protein